MITANRGRLAARALRCYARQSYANRELVVVDGGPEDLTPLLAAHAGTTAVRHVRLNPDAPRLGLGELRNLARREARFAAQLLRTWPSYASLAPAVLGALAWFQPGSAGSTGTGSLPALRRP